jgi:hypothetical protein
MPNKEEGTSMFTREELLLIVEIFEVAGQDAGFLGTTSLSSPPGMERAEILAKMAALRQKAAAISAALPEDDDFPSMPPGRLAVISCLGSGVIATIVSSANGARQQVKEIQAAEGWQLIAIAPVANIEETRDRRRASGEATGLDKTRPGGKSANPDLIPQPGVVFSLATTGSPDEYWVEMNTHGAGTVIGRVMLRHDGTWQAFLRQATCGYAEDPEAGMWACIRAYMKSPADAQLCGAGFRAEA